MKIIFFGDMAATGFGTVTMDLGRALLDRGEDVRFVSQNDLGELEEPFKSRTWNETDGTPWVSATERAGWLSGGFWRDGWKPDAAILLGDVYNVRRMVFWNEDTEAGFRSIPTYHYVPVEGIDLPPSFAHLWSVAEPIAMSEFGADEIARVIGHRPPVVYHAVDTSVFHPATPESPIRVGDELIRSKADAKRHWKWKPEWRMLLRVDSHWPRKNYGSLAESLRPVIEARPDVYLAMHCAESDKNMNDDLRDYRSRYHPNARSRMGTTGLHDRGMFLSRAELSVLYNAADVYVSTSAEGFGLTIAEAIACGVPAVGVNYSAVPEVIGPAGVTVQAVPTRNEYAHFWCQVNERAFGEAVADLLDHPRKRERLGAKGPAHIKALQSWPRAAAQFVDIMARRERKVAA